MGGFYMCTNFFFQNWLRIDGKIRKYLLPVCIMKKLQNYNNWFIDQAIDKKREFIDRSICGKITQIGTNDRYHV